MRPTDRCTAAVLEAVVHEVSEMQLEPMKASQQNMSKVAARRQAEEDRILEVVRAIQRREAEADYQPPRPVGRRSTLMNALDGRPR